MGCAVFIANLTKLNYFIKNLGIVDMKQLKNYSAYKKIVLLAVMAAVPLIASAQFGNLINELKTISGILNNTQPQKSQEARPAIAINNELNAGQDNLGIQVGKYYLHVDGEMYPSGLLNVQKSEAKKFKFELNAVNLDIQNEGYTEGVATLVGDQYVYEGTEYDCKLTFKNTGDKIVIYQDIDAGDCGFGNRVYADGDYKLEKIAAANQVRAASVAKPKASSNKAAVPIELHGKYFERTKKECSDDTAGFETLLEIKSNNISVGAIVSCEPKKISQQGMIYTIKASCSEEGEPFNGVFKIKKTSDGVVFNDIKHTKCPPNR